MFGFAAKVRGPGGRGYPLCAGSCTPRKGCAVLALFSSASCVSLEYIPCYSVISQMCTDCITLACHSIPRVPYRWSVRGADAAAWPTPPGQPTVGTRCGSTGLVFRYGLCLLPLRRAPTAPRPIPHRGWAHPCHVCTGTWLTCATSAPGLRMQLKNTHAGRGADLAAAPFGHERAGVMLDVVCGAQGCPPAA